MAQWNLSVQLRGQGTSLVRTLNRSSEAAHRLSLSVAEARGEIDQLRVSVRRLRASARHPIRFRLDVDTDGLAEARREIRALRTATRRPIRPRIDITGATRDLNALRTALPNLNGTVRVNGTSESATKIKGLAGALHLLSTALIPMAAATAPLGISLAAAGAGAASFGAAVGGQISALSEATEAQKKYDDAVAEHGRTSPEAAQAEAAFLRQIKDMPPATREAAAALSSMKDQYKDWSNSLSGTTMPVFTKSFATLGALMPKFTPMVKGAANELERLVTVVAGQVASPGFDAFMDRLSKASTHALHDIIDGLIGMARAAADFSRSAAFNEFMDYARTNGPLVAETLKNIALALMNLLSGASEVGPTVLTVVNALAELVSAVPPSVISTFVQLYAAMRLLTMGAGALVAVAGSTAAAQLATYFAVMRRAGIGTTLRATAQSMTAVQKAAVGLGVLAIGAIGISKLAEKARGAPPDVDRLTTSLKNLARTGSFTGELKKTYGDFDGLIEKMKTYQAEAKKASAASEGNFGFRIPLLDDVADWFGDRANDIAKGEDSFNALKDSFKSTDEALAGLVQSGKAQEAAAGFEVMQAAGRKAGFTTKELAALFPQYRAAVASVKAEQQLAAAAMGLFGQQAISTSQKLADQKASADGLRQSIQALNDANRAGLGGMIGFEAAIDAAATAAKKNAGALSMSHGQLNLNSEKARNAATALQDLATKTDEAAGAARASGSSWQTVNGIYARGRESLVASARAMGLTKAQAEQLADSILKIPDKKTRVTMDNEDAMTGLEAVQAKIKATPGAKSVKVSTLSKTAIAALEAVGLKTRQLPDGRTEVRTANGQSLGSIGAVRQALNSLDGKTATTYVRTNYVETRKVIAVGPTGKPLLKRDGGLVDYYGDGGIQRGGVRHFAGGSERHVAQFAKAGTWRVWAEPETGGEAYIPLAASKRTRSRAIAEQTITRLGGDPRNIQWNANGSVTDWRYDPGTGSLYSPIDAGSAGNKTRKVKTKKGTKEINYFSLSAVESKLKSTSKATAAWNKNLEIVAARAGGDVAEALASMGKEGVALTAKMAKGSTTYLNQMSAALRGLAATAKASLADYTRAIGKATATDEKFAANLAKLAGRGYGDLAKQLAAQGDEAAQQLAAAAVGDSKKASAANAAAKRANASLTGEQVQQLVAIIASISSSKTGIHDVAASTGLGEDVIVDVATRGRSQLSSALGSRATRFLSDLARAQKGLAYANGGIRAGLYGTRAGLVRFAEPETGGEAYIPLGANKRASATRVLGDVAGRFGLGLSDAAAGRVVVIREQGPLIGNQTWHVTSGSNAADTARRVDADNAYQLRRLARGGVGARG